MLIENTDFHNKTFLFSSRKKAGELLVPYLIEESIDLLLAIPNGGVPVAAFLIKPLSIPEFNLLLTRKIQVPWSTEAGFGAITPNGQIFLNNQMISYYQIEEPSIKQQIESAKSIIKKREKIFNLPQFDPFNKTILITDDGIASGFSMIAGCTWLKQQGAKKVIIGVPTAPFSSIRKIEEQNIVDRIICLNVREIYPFAVADAYTDWYDVQESEVMTILDEIKTSLSK